MIEKLLIGKRMLNLKWTVMREPDLERITFLGFEIFKIFENFKTAFGCYLSNFSAFISFQVNVFFLYRRVEVQKRKPDRKTLRYFSFLGKNIEKISMYLKDDYKIQLILPAKFSRDGRDFCFQNSKRWVSILHCTLFLLL